MLLYVIVIFHWYTPNSIVNDDDHTTNESNRCLCSTDRLVIWL